MAGRSRSGTRKKPVASSPPAAREPLIIAAAFLHGVVCISSVPVLMMQTEYVSFPSSAYLAVYQLCFLVPQLVSTLVAEQLTVHVSSPFLLFLTLMCYTGSSVVVSMGMSRRALSLMFASRLLNGLFQHDKVLFPLAAKTLHMSSTSVGAWTGYGMMAGMVLSGIAADVMKDAIRVTDLFIVVEALAAVLVLARFLSGSRIPVVTARASQEYAPWLLGLSRAPAAVYRALATVVAVMLAASVNQVVYPFMAPGYGLSYSFTGVHLGLSLLLQIVLMPYVVEKAQRIVRRWKSTILHRGSSDEKLTVMSGIVLLAGCIFVPHAADRGSLVFYSTSLLLVDIPAGVLISLTVTAARAAFGKSSRDAPKVARLLGHITQLVKMFAAPMRMCISENLTGIKHPVRCISVPLVIYALVYVRTHSVTYALVALATALLFITHSVSTFEGDL